MKKIILGIVIGLSFVGVSVYASKIISTSWYIVDTLDVDFLNYGKISKSYDENANVICYYIYNGSSGTALSCLKNK